jgi:hypothetical protein
LRVFGASMAGDQPMDANDNIMAATNIRTDRGAFVGVNEGQWVSANTEWPLVYTHLMSNGIWTFKGGGNGDGGLIFKSRTLGTTSEKMRIHTNGLVGIGTVAPDYRLDVSTGTTAASVNMSSWPRVPVANTYVAKGIQAFFTNASQFNAPLQEINTNLAIVTNSGTLGTFFQIRRSGIWSIRVGPVNHTTTGSISVLDVSTNSNALSQPPPSVRTIDVNFSTTAQYTTLNYTGYLPASTTTFYKTYHTNLTTTNPTAVFMISFIAETPTGSANYPYASYPA